MNQTKIIFMGTPDFSVPVLEGLIKNYEVVLVVTQPDKKVGRKHTLTFSPVKQLALNNQIPVFQPEKIRDDYEPILKANPDLIITCAYGQIIPESILNIPTMGAFNVHASLLPKYRGGAPIHKCLINGEKETGVTIMYMDKGMDTGDMVAKKHYTILNEDNVGTLHEKLSILGRDLLLEVLPDIINKTNKRFPQNHEEATYAYNIKREEERLDFFKKGEEVINHIRGLNPWPLANFLVNDEEYKALEATFTPLPQTTPNKVVDIKKDSIGISVLDGIVYLKKIKPYGKKAMDVKDFLNGVKKEEVNNWIIN